MFGKAFKELGECEKNKVLGALVTEHRREMRNEKRNRNRANLS